MPGDGNRAFFQLGVDLRGALQMLLRVLVVLAPHLHDAQPLVELVARLDADRRRLAIALALVLSATQGAAALPF